MMKYSNEEIQKLDVNKLIILRKSIEEYKRGCVDSYNLIIKDLKNQLLNTENFYNSEILIIDKLIDEKLKI